MAEEADKIKKGVNERCDALLNAFTGALDKHQTVTKHHSFLLVRLQSQMSELREARTSADRFQEAMLNELRDCYETIAYLKGRIARLSVEFYSSKATQPASHAFDDLDDTPKMMNRHKNVHRSWYSGDTSPTKGSGCALATGLSVPPLTNGNGIAPDTPNVNEKVDALAELVQLLSTKAEQGKASVAELKNLLAGMHTNHTGRFERRSEYKNGELERDGPSAEQIHPL